GSPSDPPPEEQHGGKLSEEEFVQLFGLVPFERADDDPTDDDDPEPDGPSDPPSTPPSGPPAGPTPGTTAPDVPPSEAPPLDAVADVQTGVQTDAQTADRPNDELAAFLAEDRPRKPPSQYAAHKLRSPSRLTAGSSTWPAGSSAISARMRHTSSRSAV